MDLHRSPPRAWSDCGAIGALMGCAGRGNDEAMHVRRLAWQLFGSLFSRGKIATPLECKTVLASHLNWLDS